MSEQARSVADTLYGVAGKEEVASRRTEGHSSLSWRSTYREACAVESCVRTYSMKYGLNQGTFNAFLLVQDVLASQDLDGVLLSF